jgi:hypothetical protein
MEAHFQMQFHFVIKKSRHLNTCMQGVGENSFEPRTATSKIYCILNKHTTQLLKYYPTSG